MNNFLLVDEDTIAHHHGEPLAPPDSIDALKSPRLDGNDSDETDGSNSLWSFKHSRPYHVSLPLTDEQDASSEMETRESERIVCDSQHDKPPVLSSVVENIKDGLDCCACCQSTDVDGMAGEEDEDDGEEEDDDDDSDYLDEDLPDLSVASLYRRLPQSPVMGPFFFVKSLASGAYGEAFMVRDLSTEADGTGRLLCMKVMNKKHLLERDLLGDALTELVAYKQISFQCHSAQRLFLMDLDGVMQDEQNIYFAMDLMHSDLLTLLDKDRVYCRSNARRWVAQTAFGISALHDMGIIHRDIKPENLLIDFRGNIRITDLGAAYVHAAPLDVHEVYTDEVIGTWQYMAPEIVRCSNAGAARSDMYGLAVDYWALGCVVYDLEAEDTGPAFPSREELQNFVRWRKSENFGQSYFSFAGLSQNAEALITGLLRRDPCYRYGIGDLRKHPYFLDRNRRSQFGELSDDVLAVRRPALFKSTYDATIPVDTTSLVSLQLLSLDPRGVYAFDNFGWVNPNGIWGRNVRRWK